MSFNWQHRTNKNRLLPILHEDIWKLKKNIEASSWLATEIDLSKDKYGYKSMWIYRILDLHDNIICIQCDRNLKLKRILK